MLELSNYFKITTACSADKQEVRASQLVAPGFLPVLTVAFTPLCCLTFTDDSAEATTSKTSCFVLENTCLLAQFSVVRAAT